MSPGRYAVPLGMFSAAPRYPCTGNGGSSSAATCTAPSTAALPAMSVFMSAMFSAVFSERPPESKVMALPTSATGRALAAEAFFGR